MILIWTLFIAFILSLLVLDLFVVNRKDHEIGAREALSMTAVFVTLALMFGGVVYFLYQNHVAGMGLGPVREDGTRAMLDGRTALLQFYTGWLVEYALSMDNIFVISVIFTYFQVPKIYQHRVLFWGIMGAIVMRGVMIVAGAALIHSFHWMIYVFGGLLILTAIKMLVSSDEVEPDNNFAVKLAHRFLPFTERYHGSRFFAREEGKLLATPLFLVLVVVETTDLLFAVDSIPAIFAITKDPFLVFTSNMFAIVGLRSLYFALAAIVDKFRYLKLSLVFVLAYVGVKMLVSETWPIPTYASLGVIITLLGVGIGASIWRDRREARRRPRPIEDLAEAAEVAWKRSRRIVIFVIGITILLIAIPVAILPGPGGIFVVIGGLMVLATEFVWAAVLLKKLKNKARELREMAERAIGLRAAQDPVWPNDASVNGSAPTAKDTAADSTAAQSSPAAERTPGALL